MVSETFCLFSQIFFGGEIEYEKKVLGRDYI